MKRKTERNQEFDSRLLGMLLYLEHQLPIGQKPIKLTPHKEPKPGCRYCTLTTRTIQKAGRKTRSA